MYLCICIQIHMYIYTNTYAATYFRTLQHSALHDDATLYNTPQIHMQHCNTLQHTTNTYAATYFGTLQHSTTHDDANAHTA